MAFQSSDGGLHIGTHRLMRFVGNGQLDGQTSHLFGLLLHVALLFRYEGLCLADVIK